MHLSFNSSIFLFSHTNTLSSCFITIMPSSFFALFSSLHCCSIFLIFMLCLLIHVVVLSFSLRCCFTFFSFLFHLFSCFVLSFSLHYCFAFFWGCYFTFYLSHSACFFKLLFHSTLNLLQVINEKRLTCTMYNSTRKMIGNSTPILFFNK